MITSENDFCNSPLLEIYKITRQPRGSDIRTDLGARLALHGGTRPQLHNRRQHTCWCIFCL